MSEVRYTRKEGDEQRRMEISGIPLHPAIVDMSFDEDHVFTIIQQTPIMKLCEGSCKQRKGEFSQSLCNYTTDSNRYRNYVSYVLRILSILSYMIAILKQEFLYHNVAYHIANHEILYHDIL